MRSRLLTMLRWWICIFSLIWSLLLFLSSSFLLILGQELLETRPLLFVVSGIFFRNPRWTGGPVSRSVRPVWADLASFFYSCPPSAEFFNESSGTFFAGASWWDFEGSDLSSPMIIFFPFIDLAWFGRINTLGLLNSSTCVCAGKGFWSTCIYGTIIRPSLTADWICLRSTLQSLVTWEKVLRNLQ